MLTLCVSHLIFLDDDQRNLLLNGQPIEVTGVSVPVWFNMGTTSEPASEVFCRYQLTNESVDYSPLILSNGYKINVPQIPPNMTVPVRPDSETISKVAKVEVDQWLKENPIPAENPTDLFDPNDGGIGLMYFRRQVKHIENGRLFNVLHNIVVQPLTRLLTSITVQA